MKSYFSLLFLLISISTAISQSRMNIQFGIGYELLPDRILKYQRTYSEYFYHTDTTELVKEYTAQAESNLNFENPTNVYLGYAVDIKSYKRFHLSIGTMWNLKKYKYIIELNHLNSSNRTLVSEKVVKKTTFFNDINSECDSTIFSIINFNSTAAVTQHFIQIPISIRYQLSNDFALQTKLIPSFTVAQSSLLPAIKRKIEVVNDKKICRYCEATNKEYTYQFSNPTFQLQFGGRYDYNKWFAFEGNFTYDFRDILRPDQFNFYNVSRYPSKPIGIQVLTLIKF